MKRRNALSVLTAVAGGSLVAPSLLLSGCRPEPEISYRFFSREDIPLLDQIGETILPATPDSPGAGAVGIGEFMDVYVTDCLREKDQLVLREGLDRFRTTCQEQYGNSFLKLSASQQQQFLEALDKEAEAYREQEPPLPPLAPSHYFTLLKTLTLLGYFTSEAGATQALRYVPVPGRYEGSIPYEKGDKAWAL